MPERNPDLKKEKRRRPKKPNETQTKGMKVEKEFLKFLSDMGMPPESVNLVSSSVEKIIQNAQPRVLYPILKDRDFEHLLWGWMQKNCPDEICREAALSTGYMRFYRDFVLLNGIADTANGNSVDEKNKTEGHREKNDAPKNEISTTPSETSQKTDKEDAATKVVNESLRQDKAAVLKMLEQQEKSDEFVRDRDETQRLFCRAHPGNETQEDVLPKVKFVASRLKIPFFDCEKTAAHIVSCHIDEDLKLGDEIVVKNVAEVAAYGKVRNEYLFAAAYCHCHAPEKFPLFSTDTERAMRFFRDETGFYWFFNDELKNYAKYIRLLRIFREKAGLDGLTLDQISRYLQIVGKELKTKK